MRSSLTKLRDTQHAGRAVPGFDLAVMDEAHRIAGQAEKNPAARRGHRRELVTANGLPIGHLEQRSTRFYQTSGAAASIIWAPSAAAPLEGCR
ncbi:hypothetical protein [Streptomyces sp. NPDC054887]